MRKSAILNFVKYLNLLTIDFLLIFVMFLVTNNDHDWTTKPFVLYFLEQTFLFTGPTFQWTVEPTWARDSTYTWSSKWNLKNDSAPESIEQRVSPLISHGIVTLHHPMKLEENLLLAFFAIALNPLFQMNEKWKLV